jgi:pimeloyl-ACP methyl ester carboxylesterase/DNA-binding CsgD family transcriptional regulator
MNQQLRFVTTRDGVRLGCAIQGSGPPLVKAPTWLSHAGMDAESPVWRHWWEELSREHEFIRFDQRGSGLSDRTVSGVSMESWVRDLGRVVDALDVERFVLLGMSQGGPISVEYAKRHPDRVERLVIVGGYARGWRKRGQPVDEHVALLTLIERGWGKDNSAFRQVFTSQFMPGATQEQMAWFNELERVSASPEMALKFQQAVGEIDVSESARALRVPAIVFHSMEDARVPFDEGRRLAALIPGARFVALPSKNHILLETEPAWDLFRQEFRAFLRSTPEGPPALEGNRPLTRREREVLTLVAAGLTDRQVAEKLSLSPRTINNHVTNILAKLDVPNRAAAAIVATRDHLL